MFKLKRNIRPRIPDALAAVAAITLVATSLVGSTSNTQVEVMQSAGVESQSVTPAAWAARETSVEEGPVSQTKRKTGFRVNLFLFRHH